MILIDTSVIVAYHNSRDQHHEEAKEILKRFENHPRFISDYIFDESVTFSLARNGHHAAKRVGTSLLTSDIKIVKISDEIFRKAWGIFEKYEKFSFTDCTTIAAAELFCIKKIATFDREFSGIPQIETISK